MPALSLSARDWKNAISSGHLMARQMSTCSLSREEIERSGNSMAIIWMPRWRQIFSAGIRSVSAVMRISRSVRCCSASEAISSPDSHIHALLLKGRRKVGVGQVIVFMDAFFVPAAKREGAEADGEEVLAREVVKHIVGFWPPMRFFARHGQNDFAVVFAAVIKHNAPQFLAVRMDAGVGDALNVVRRQEKPGSLHNEVEISPVNADVSPFFHFILSLLKIAY